MFPGKVTNPQAETENPNDIREFCDAVNQAINGLVFTFVLMFEEKLEITKLDTYAWYYLK